MLRFAIAAIALLLSATSPSVAVAADAGPEIDRAWARATPGTATVGAAYLRIRSTADDRLVSLASPVADKVELHNHVERDGTLLMVQMDNGLPVKAGETVELRSGGLHIMLIDLKSKLKAGDRFPLTLTFEKAGPRAVSVQVEPLGARGPSADATGPRPPGAK